MDPTPLNPTLTRRGNVILILIFAVLIWLPTLDALFHFDRTPALNEKRVPAPFPQLKSGPGGLKEYTAGLDAYFNDHFGCRNRLIYWHTKWNHDFFRASGIHKVLIGKDGWLFWEGDQMVENYRGISQFTPQELADWNTLLEHRRDWLAQRGIKYVFVVVPDKQTIYPEYLPDWMTKVRTETKRDQFLAYMHSHSTVEILDLAPVLREAKKTAPVYFKNDAHWNYFGGFLGSEEIIKALSQQLPELAPLSLDSFELKKMAEHTGDLETYLGMDLVEDNAVSLEPKPGLPALKTSNPLDQGVFFISTNSAARDNVVVFRDSFASAMEPYLGLHFGKATYIWTPQLKPELIEREKPVVVISLTVERNFIMNDPKELMKLDALK